MFKLLKVFQANNFKCIEVLQDKSFPFKNNLLLFLLLLRRMKFNIANELLVERSVNK